MQIFCLKNTISTHKEGIFGKKKTVICQILKKTEQNQLISTTGSSRQVAKI
jgi:hypothetical protein